VPTTSKGRGRRGVEGERKRGERMGNLCWPDHFSKADYGSVVVILKIMTLFCGHITEE